MAKTTLKVFGFLTVLPGILLIWAGLESNRIGIFVISAGLGSAFFLAGAPLLGFARVIELLERIEQNTRRF